MTSKDIRSVRGILRLSRTDAPSDRKGSHRALKEWIMYEVNGDLHE